MKILESDFYFGAALKQLADVQTITSINKLGTKDGRYAVNDEIDLLLKYATAKKSPWQFTVRHDDLAHLPELTGFLVLICGNKTICALNSDEIDSVLDRKARRAQSLRVLTASKGSMRVRGPLGTLGHVVPHNRFPDLLFGPSPKGREQWLWPALSTLKFYRTPGQLWLSTTDRNFDLSDNITGAAVGVARAKVWMGVSSICPIFARWSEANLNRIEKNIRYDLEFDGYSVDIKRVTNPKPGRSGAIEGWEEFVWELTIRESC